jgi:hypothetical protein
LVADFNSGPRSSEPAVLTAVGDRLYFSADDGRHGREMWRVVSSPWKNPDVNGDQLVDLADLARLQQHLGAADAAAAAYDLNGDGIVGRGDVAILARQFGRRPLGPGDVGVATVAQPAAAIVDAVLSDRRSSAVAARTRAVRRPIGAASVQADSARPGVKASADVPTSERQTLRAHRRT